MAKFYPWYQAFLGKLEDAAYSVSAVLLGLLLCNEAVGLFFDIFGYSITWIPEMSVLLLSWVCFIGAGAISRRGGHISLDFIVERLPNRFQFLLRVGYVILATILVIVMLYFGLKMAIFAGRYQSSVYLHIPLFYYYLSVPVGGLLIGLSFAGTIMPSPEVEITISKLEKIEENPLY